MANYDESDEDIFITESSYSNCSPIGSDTDEVLNDVLELEASKYVKGFSEILECGNDDVKSDDGVGAKRNKERQERKQI